MISEGTKAASKGKRKILPSRSANLLDGRNGQKE